MHDRGLSSEHTLSVLSGANRKPIYTIPKKSLTLSLTHWHVTPVFGDQLQDGAKKTTVS